MASSTSTSSSHANQSTPLSPNSLIAQVYYDPKQTGAYYGSVKKIFENSSLRKHNISEGQIKQWLMSQESTTVHRGIHRRFKKNRVLSIHEYNMFDLDLADFSNIAKENDGYHFLLLAIDILSKKLYGVAIKNKATPEILRALKIIFSSLPKPVSKVRSDSGAEFTSKQAENYFKSLNIKHTIARNTETKANYVERVIRTIRGRLARFFTYNQTRRYIDNIQDFIYSYNNSFHRSIGMTPNQVNSKTEWIAFKNHYLLPLQKKPKKRKTKVYNQYKIGDSVRISRLRSTFPSKYGSNWSFEIFRIKNAYIREGIPVYKLADWNGEIIKGVFYQNEITKITAQNSDFYHIDQVLKRRKKGKKITHYFVSWKGWPATFNSWISAAQLKK